MTSDKIFSVYLLGAVLENKKGYFFEKGGIAIISSIITLVISSIFNIIIQKINLKETYRIEKLRTIQSSVEYEKKYKLIMIENFGLDYHDFYKKNVELVWFDYTDYYLFEKESKTLEDLHYVLEDYDLTSWPLFKNANIVDLGYITIQPNNEDYMRVFGIEGIDQDVSLELFSYHLSEIQNYMILVQRFILNEKLNLFENDYERKIMNDQIGDIYFRLVDQKHIVLDFILYKEIELLDMTFEDIY